MSDSLSAAPRGSVSLRLDHGEAASGHRLVVRLPPSTLHISDDDAAEGQRGRD